MSFSSASFYDIDVTVTDNCNFRCKYCFERSSEYIPSNFQLTDQFITQLELLLSDDWFKCRYDGVHVAFWGGEPTLLPKVIIDILQYFEGDDRVKFFLYTNASNISVLEDVLMRTRDQYIAGFPKFHVQISYDGKPIHDMNRVNPQRRSTSKCVLEAIDFMERNNIPFSTKSTVMPENFKYLHDAYLDVRQLEKEGRKYPHTFNHNRWRLSSYYPTVDQADDSSIRSEEVEKRYLEDLEISLIKIAQDEIKYYKTYKRWFFRWFDYAKPVCLAGKDMCCIDTNGNIYPCHGCIYMNTDSHVAGSLTEGLLPAIIKLHEQFKFIASTQPEECLKCVATYCARCNSAKFQYSQKDEYMDRWTDYSVQPFLCQAFGLNGKISTAFHRILGR